LTEAQTIARREQNRKNQHVRRRRSRAGEQQFWLKVDVVMLLLRTMSLDAGLDLSALQAGRRSARADEARALRDDRLNAALLRIVERGVIDDTSRSEAALLATMLRDKLHRKIV
jgi:hypothetical protein